MKHISLSKLDVDLYQEIITEHRETRLFNDCIKHFKKTYPTLPSKRLNFTLGDEGLVYTVSFGGYGDRPKVESKREALPWDTIPSIVRTRKRLSELLDKEFTCCIVQYYPSGKYGILPHKDKEISKGDNTIIAGLSLGCARTLTLTPPKFLNLDPLNLTLEPRSLYVLNSPTNDYWMHSIPKDDSTLPRISLTFRDL